MLQAFALTFWSMSGMIRASSPAVAMLLDARESCDVSVF